MVHEQQCYYADQCGFLNQCLPDPTIGVESFCIHDPTLPLTIYTSIIYAITPIFLGIGVLGGLGGGILKGPVLELLLGYSQVQATIIGYCFMFGGCVINAIFLVFEKNPIDPERPIIDYDLAMIFNCSLTLGVSFGGIVNIFVPQFYVSVFQQIFLLTACPYLYKKGMKAMQDSRKEKTRVEEQSLIVINEQKPNINRSAETADMECYQELYKKIRSEDTNTIPITKWTIILIFFLTTQLFMTLLPIQLEETLNLPFKIKYLMVACLIVVNIPMSYIVYLYGSKNDKNKISVSYTLSGMYFERNKFLFIYASGFLSGLVSGMLGLGSGLILVPVMLYLKMHPRVSSSTSAFCYFWMGLTNLLNLLINKLMELDDALLFLGLALFGGSVITRIGNTLVVKYNCSYMVIFIVFGLGVSNIIVGIWYVVKESQSFGFHSLLESQD